MVETSVDGTTINKLLSGHKQRKSGDEHNLKCDGFYLCLLEHSKLTAALKVKRGKEYMNTPGTHLIEGEGFNL